MKAHKNSPSNIVLYPRGPLALLAPAASACVQSLEESAAFVTAPLWLCSLLPLPVPDGRPFPVISQSLAFPPPSTRRAPRRRISGEMSRFGRSGPPPIRDTYSLLVLNITFREFPSRCGASVSFQWFELAAHLCLGAPQGRRLMTSSRSSTSTARSSTSTSPGTAGECEANKCDGCLIRRFES